ncbi:MAG: hypothetical protein JXQ75_11875 [Phycisphaerae bacterium]|nr:hypothetical protein [Phycisphaerae bacterium]
MGLDEPDGAEPLSGPHRQGFQPASHRRVRPLTGNLRRDKVHKPPPERFGRTLILEGGHPPHSVQVVGELDIPPRGLPFPSGPVFVMRFA